MSKRTRFISSSPARSGSNGRGCLVATEGDFVCIPDPSRIDMPDGRCDAKHHRRESLGPKLARRAKWPAQRCADLKFAISTPPCRPAARRSCAETLDTENTVFTMPHDRLPLWRAPVGVRPGVEAQSGQHPGSTLTCQRAVRPASFCHQARGRSDVQSQRAVPEAAHPLYQRDFERSDLLRRGPGAWGGCTEPGTLTCVPRESFTRAGPRTFLRAIRPGCWKHARRCVGHRSHRRSELMRRPYRPHPTTVK